jgi:hypothetical protein
MKKLSTENIEKLRTMEENFIKGKMESEPTDSNPKFHDVDPELAELTKNNRGNYSHDFPESLAKNHYKKEFCDDLIANFDERMKEIGSEEFSTEEKEGYLGALQMYSMNLGDYNRYRTKYVRELFTKDMVDVENSNKMTELQDKSIESVSEQVEGSFDMSSTQVVAPKRDFDMYETQIVAPREPVDLNALPQEDMNMAREKSLGESVTDFFAGVHRFFRTGLKSWWTGIPLDKVQEAYDKGENLTREQHNRNVRVEEFSTGTEKIIDDFIKEKDSLSFSK